MFVKKLANHMTRTNGQSLSNTMTSIRRRLRFELVKATLILSLPSEDTEVGTTRKPSLSRNKIAQVTLMCKMTRVLMTYDDDTRKYSNADEPNQ